MFRLLLLLSLVLALSACDRKSAPAPPVMVPSPGTETITGSERIGWDQPASDTAELATINYVLYVDSNRTPLTGVTCATTASAIGFACTAPLPAMTPGPHALQLASYITDGAVLEGTRSGVLQVTVSTQVSRQAAAAPPAGPVRFTTAHGVTMRVEPIAEGLNQPTDLGFVADGRLFVAERGGRVRVIRDKTLLPDPALSLAETLGAGTTLLAVAADPDFERTHFLFAVYVSPSRSGEPMFTLARFREAANTLADRIVLLDGVRASASPAAIVRFGADKKLYIALDDGGDARRSSDPASLNGKILRLNADATTPAAQRGLSPVYADGLAAPRGFDWDPILGKPSKALATSAAPYRGRLFPDFAGRLIMADPEGRLALRSATGQSETFAPDRIAGVTAVGVSPDGAIYYATANAIGRLVPDTP